MVRRFRCSASMGMRFPHARGDGPRLYDSTLPRIAFSPRPWGWSACYRLRRRRGRVFPTPVGMVRAWRRPGRGATSFPHARGDGPTPINGMQIVERLSPRPWGWSVGNDCLAGQQRVFPTPVGMVRRTAHSTNQVASFPHARGDGPGGGLGCHPSKLFSPRPWGWSVSPA